MSGWNNSESISSNAREYNNSTNFVESWNATEFLNTVNKTDWAKEVATELNKTSFGDEIAWYAQKGREIKENNLLEKYKNCPSTNVDVTKPSNWEKPVEEIVKGMWAMAEDIGIKNAEFTHKWIDKNTGGTVTADLQWKIWDEVHTVTYLSDCIYWKWSGSDEKCLIHSYGDPVYYADTPVDFA